MVELSTGNIWAWRLLFILAALGLCWHRILHYGAQASLVAEHGLSSCPVARGACHVGILVPCPRTEPWSPALEGGFLTTVPPGKSWRFIFQVLKFNFLNSYRVVQYMLHFGCFNSLRFPRNHSISVVDFTCSFIILLDYPFDVC